MIYKVTKIGVALFVFCSVIVEAQVLISPMGGFQQNSSISISFSAGEVIAGDFSSESFSFNSGFSGINTGILISNEENKVDLPKEFELNQNYPNPFNPSTNIEFSLPKTSRLKLEVFNSIGMRIAVLIDEQKPAGFHTVRFDAASYSSGMYFYRLVADENIIATKKMILIK
ncbi:MAG: T9SS type A sorting domain-containing protein [Balneolaceae bacterium]